MDDSRRSTAPPKEPSGRVCTVCSDRANGYNFGVLTCESCKAFFRRNAAKYNDIKCPFSNSCQITSASRKFCQACRLNKCFTVGMKSDWLNDAKSKNTGKFKRKKPDVQMKVEVQEEEDEGENDKEENNDEGDEKISVSKALYDKLVHKATQRDHCICTCQCGFYPVTQRLTAFETIENVPTHDHSLTSSATHSPASNICSTPSTFDSSNYSTLHLNPSSNSNPNSNSNSIHQPQSSLSPSNYKMQFPMGADCSQAQMLSPFELGSQMMNQMGKMESRPGGPPSILSFFPPMPERPWTPVAENIPTIEAFPEVANSPPVDLMVKIHQSKICI
uniref:Nuclear receptor domain-containing protein n=1 Tax=Caenorhabditis japonica TaxID=281687 RepID=A0A8R1I5U6_CAEJA